ncbi:hypothetical protein SKP52_21690 [Sphingopyxis fribergensis]|uniref:TonB C-terminal domain-containing protein n=1 Tax=Sphingopyxis fribergensis TaxID=1515612 RepID=A0A0A7PT38_9SPHN|nr:energy transducer TonB [Sphingopyxis fribergensis]AJA11192.1 hypothetical protein SKP52_21690 [Sphingopyxis fribergensis]
MKHAALSLSATHARHPADEQGPPTQVEGAQPDPISRYSDQPMDWRTRFVGLSGTTAVFLLVAAATLLTWQLARPTVVPKPLAVNLLPLAAPTEPTQDVPEGPRQIEQEQQSQEREEQPVLPEIMNPRVSPVTRPTPPKEQSRAADPVPETTAPKSLAAPPADQASSNSEATWEALLLAHLERYRRYPAAARARREQGVAHVRFRMTRDGQVLSSEIIRSSGSSALDRAALDTLRRAQPLPAVPATRPAPLELAVPVEFFLNR